MKLLRFARRSLSIALSIACLSVFLSGCADGSGDAPKATPEKTPDPSIFYPKEEELKVTPDKNKYLDVTVLEEGYDIYAPAAASDWGYRYGPSLMTYADGSMDAWFAAPGTDGEWDWITYRHYDPESKQWSDEIAVLHPTPDSMDWLSCCDPGVTYFNGYYYLGYTSTIDDTYTGVRNNVFVARSKNPDGPYEKWNGSGWGGNPQPIIYFDETADRFGAGEPSFVERDGTLYIYYTWSSRNSGGTAIRQTRVATADAASENWPATIEYQGVAITNKSDSNDSADVKYIEDYGKFIAICTDNRFAANSMVCVYESNDGIAFQRVNELKSNLIYKCHNAGISSRPNGHIRISDDIYLGYAYGDTWGCWGTRIHKVQIGLSDEINMSDSKNKSIPQDVVKWDLSDRELWTVGITAIPHYFKKNVSSGPFDLALFWQDTLFEKHQITDAKAVTFSGYDSSLVKISGFSVTPLKAGETVITATYDGRSIDIPIKIYEDSVQLNQTDPALTSFTPMKETYTLSLSAKDAKQVRGMAVYADTTWNEVYRGADGVAYSGYDDQLIRVDANGLVQPRSRKGSEGSTQITVSYKDKSFTVTINIVA